MDSKLQFRRVTGEEVEIEAQLDDDEILTGELLVARKVWLDDGTELRQHRPASGPQRAEGYNRLDNEILAGRRLYEASGWGNYPPELACLYGDEATSADPYTLFEAYVGRPLRETGMQIIDEEFDAFQVSLLTGLCWLAAAGIAHRAISPDTVLWDGTRRQVQIVAFSRSTVFGVPRTPVTGVPGWVPKEQRPRTCEGRVGPRDDVWAAGRLIFFVRNQGEDLVDRRQLTDSGLDGLFNGMFDGVLGPPERRPTAWELLEDGLKRRNPVPPAADSAWLIEGREHFLEARQRTHPGAIVPPGFNADIDWMVSPAGGPAPVLGNDGRPAATGPASADAAPSQTRERAGDRTEETNQPRRFRWGRGQG